MLQRLHTSHKPPAGDLSFRYDRGYCLSLRIADGTTTAAAALNQLESLINGATVAAATAGNQQVRLLSCSLINHIITTTSQCYPLQSLALVNAEPCDG